MSAATALVTANAPDAQLAEEAVAQALATAGLTQASAVLLFLTPGFSRHAQAAATAAARRARCLQVAGGIAPGILTQDGWAVVTVWECAMRAADFDDRLVAAVRAAQAATISGAASSSPD